MLHTVGICNEGFTDSTETIQTNGKALGVTKCTNCNIDLRMPHILDAKNNSAIRMPYAKFLKKALFSQQTCLLRLSPYYPCGICRDSFGMLFNHVDSIDNKT